MSKLILVLFFLSGACGLIHEVVWTRLLSHVFGTTVYAVSTVLAAYMAGLALGSYLFGKIIDKYDRPLKMFGILEAGIGITALLVPYFFNVLGNIYVVFHSVNNNYVFSIIRFLTSFLVLMIPTTLMGGTLPVLSKYFIKKFNRLASNMGKIYSVNTFGAMAGSLIAGFILIENIGIGNTIIFASVTNLIIAGIVLRVEVKDRVPAVQNYKPEQVISEKYPLWIGNIVLFVFAISGFCALAYEVLWSRILVYALRSLTYSFTLMLSTVLFGIALGSYLFSKIIDRNKHLLTTLGLLETMIGLVVFLGMLGFGSVSKFCFYSGDNWLNWIIIRFIACSLIMLLPAMLMGGAFPLVGKIYINSIKKIGKSTANMYSVNTVGAIIGSLVAGFIMIPLFGVQKSIFIFGLVNIIGGLVVIMLDNSTGKKFKGFSVLVVTIFTIVFFLIISFNKPLASYSRHFNKANAKLLFYKEDVTATVSVIEVEGDRLLDIDGFVAAHILNTEYMSMIGHLPLLVHDNPKDVLVICFGTGMTCGAVSRHNVDHIDCVEISPAVIEAAPYFTDINYNILTNKKLNIIIDDGRNYLLYTKKKYDIITMEPMHPSLSGVVNFYSKEFYELCKKRLKSGGVICQWAPMHVLSVDDYKMIIKTFQEVFPHTSLWLVDTEGILIGTMVKLKLDFDLLRKTINRKAVKQSLDKIQIQNIYTILDAFLLGEEKVREFSEKSRLLTDYYPYIEFSGPRNLLLSTDKTWALNNQELVNQMENVLPYISNILVKEYPSISSKINHNYLLSKNTLQARIYARMNDTERLINELSKMFLLNASNERIKTFLSNDEKQLKYFYFKLGNRFRKEGANNNAILAFNKVLDLDPLYAKAYNNLGIVYSTMNMHRMSEKNIRKSLEIDPNNAVAYTNLGILYFDEGNLDKALPEFNKAVKIDYQCAHARYYLAEIYKSKGMLGKAIKELFLVLKINPKFERAQSLLEELKKRKL